LTGVGWCRSRFGQGENLSTSEVPRIKLAIAAK